MHRCSSSESTGQRWRAPLYLVSQFEDYAELVYQFKTAHRAQAHKATVAGSSKLRSNISDTSNLSESQ